MTTNSDTSEIIKKLNSLGEEMKDLKESLKDESLDIHTAIINSRMDLHEEIKNVRRRIREVKDTLDTFIRLSDSTLQDTRGRVSRIEDILKLPPVK